MQGTQDARGLLAVADGRSRPELKDWQHSLCGDLCGDCGTCCYGFFCTPCLYGRNYAEFHDVGCCGACCLYTWCWCMTCYFATDLRRSIRNKYNLKPQPCNDFILHIFCSPCALCQESKEMRYWENQGGGGGAFTALPLQQPAMTQ